jgi:hypothetical protein
VLGQAEVEATLDQLGDVGQALHRAKGWVWLSRTSPTSAPVFSLVAAPRSSRGSKTSAYPLLVRPVTSRAIPAMTSNRPISPPDVQLEDVPPLYAA